VRNTIIAYAVSILLLCTLQSCFILGIHKEVKNPKRAGKYPTFNESVKLQGALNTKYRTCFDATFYRLNISIDDVKKYLKGEVKMNADALADFDTLQIDLYANMKINSIFFTDVASGMTTPIAAFQRKLGAVFIKMPRQIKQKEKFSLVINYEGSPLEAKRPPWRGGFVWKKDSNKKPWIGVACESEGASLWWPCKDVNNDEPDSVAVNINVTKGLTAASNGRLLGKEETESKTTFKWMISYPINLYDVSVYIGDFKEITDTYTMPSGKVLPINHYVLNNNYEKAKSHFEQAKKQIAFYEKTFGEYPWYRDGYKLIESPYEGMEHQTAIAYGNKYKNFWGGDFDYIILHESAHEWWGNAITASDFADVWLQEGFATYSEALYVESTQGKNAYLRYMAFYRLFIKNKWPVVGPENRRYFYYKNSDCYQKGAWILHTLRTTINDDKKFFSILNTFFDRYKYKTTCSKDFISIVNELTNDDYTWFFNQYLYNRLAPILEYYWSGDTFYYKWKSTNTDFKMPVNLMLDGVVEKNITPSHTIQTTAISNISYKQISFNDIYLLYGVVENKALKKEFEKK